MISDDEFKEIYKIVLKILFYGAVFLSLLVICALVVLAALAFSKWTSHGFVIALLIEVSPLLLTIICIFLFARHRFATSDQTYDFLLEIADQKNTREGEEASISFITLIVVAANLVTEIALAVPSIFFMVMSTIFKWHIRTANPILVFWALLNIAIAYKLAILGNMKTSIVLALIISLCTLNVALSQLQMFYGVVMAVFWSKSKMRTSLGTVLVNAFLFTCSFGCIHYDLFKFNSHNYGGIATWQDSLYFSFVTITTVGYGDVVPITPIARWACIFQILCGVMMLIVALNTTMTIWLHDQEEKALVIDKKAAKELVKLKLATYFYRLWPKDSGENE